MNAPSLQEIATALNGRIRHGRVRAPGIGHSQHDDGFVVWPAPGKPGGVAFTSFNGDPLRDSIFRLKDAGLWRDGEIDRPLKPEIAPAAPVIDEGRREDAQRLWAKSQPGEGTPSQTYLRARGFNGRIPATIRFVPAGVAGAHPMLIAACGDVDQDEDGEVSIKGCDVRAVIRIYLSADGRRKAALAKPKLSLGPIKARPCWLRSINDGLALSICEGIEDALSLGWPLGIGAWAIGGAGNFRSAAALVPAYVETVLLGEDNNPAGQKGCDEAERVLLDRCDWLSGRPPEIRRVRVWEGGAE